MSVAAFDAAEFERAQVAELDAVQGLLAAEGVHGRGSCSTCTP